MLPRCYWKQLATDREDCIRSPNLASLVLAVTVGQPVTSGPGGGIIECLMRGQHRIYQKLYPSLSCIHWHSSHLIRHFERPAINPRSQLVSASPSRKPLKMPSASNTSHPKYSLKPWKAMMRSDHPHGIAVVGGSRLLFWSRMQGFFF